MKVLKSENDFANLLKEKKAIIVVFVDEFEQTPSQSLLNYLDTNKISRMFIPSNIFIWKNIDQKIYEKYKVFNFPQLSVLKNDDVIFSFIGYNREKANQALQLLCQALGKGRPQKVLNLNAKNCPNGHEMKLVTKLQEQQYIRGCFECDSCKLLSHFEKDKIVLHCDLCSFDRCYNCSHEDVLI